MKFRMLIPAVAGIAFTGCVSTVNIPSFPKQDITTIEGDFKDSRYKVIVTGVKGNEHGNHIAGDLTAPATVELEKLIQESGAINVNIDRSLRDQLDKELHLYEARGESNYETPAPANLAVNGIITSATFSSRFHSGDKDTQSYCNYTAELNGILRSFKINPLKTLLPVQITGIATKRVAGSSCRGISDREQKTMFLAALKNAYDSKAAAVKTLMASSGYVQEAKMDPATSKFYYRISIEPQSGAQPGVGVVFMENQEFEGKKEIYPFAKGEVVCWLGKDTAAWAELKTDGVHSKIKIGTPVKLKFSDDMWAGIGRWLNASSPGIPLMIPGLGCNP